jgi:hypothetical protein
MTEQDELRDRELIPLEYGYRTFTKLLACLEAQHLDT